MQKVLLFSDSTKEAFSAWTPWLSSVFEIAQITNIVSLESVVKTWQPHLIITHTSSSLHPLISNTISLVHNHRLNWIVVTEQYNLKAEISAFQNGADHFLLLATPIESLKSRIISLFKKSASVPLKDNAGKISSLPLKLKVLRSGPIELHLSHQMLMVKNKIRFVTPTQYRLLELFLSHPNQLLTRDFILQTVFRKKIATLRSIDAQIAKLKKSVPEIKDALRNQYGKGYVFASEITEAA